VTKDKERVGTERLQSEKKKREDVLFRGRNKIRKKDGANRAHESSAARLKRRQRLRVNVGKERSEK